jgi:hypothetical protein
MFTIEIDEVEYKFSFKHHQDAEPHAYTACYVVKDNTKGISFNYYAWLHPHDRYCRETGRKVALTKALKDLFPDNKAARAAVWNMYLKTIKDAQEEAKRLSKLTPAEIAIYRALKKNTATVYMP